MDKPFRPLIVNPSAMYMHEAYGITDNRRRYLCDMMALIHEEMRGTITPVHHRIDRLADISSTAAEFAFCICVDTSFLERNRNFL